MSFKLVSEVLYEWDLKPLDKMVMIVLAEHANEDHAWRCHPSIKRMMKATGMARNTVKAALQRLEDLGCIRVLDTGGGRVSSEYQVNHLWTAVDTEGQEMTPPVNYVGGGQEMTPRGSGDDPEPVIEPVNRKTTQKEIETLRDQIWDEWPKESRKRTTRHNLLQKLTKALKDDSMTPDEMLGAFRHWLSEQDRKEDGKFVPGPERFFNTKAHLDHRGKSAAPTWGVDGMSDFEREVLKDLERKRKRQQEGSSNPEPTFQLAGGMR